MPYVQQVDYTTKPGTSVLSSDATKEFGNIYIAINQIEGGIGTFASWPNITDITVPGPKAPVTVEQSPFRSMVIGDVRLSPVATLPTGVPSDIVLLFLAGQLVSKTTYPLLFTRYGYSFDVSQVADNFRLPNLNGTTPVFATNQGGGTTNGITAAWASAQGGKGGAETYALNTGNLPPHNVAIPQRRINPGGNAAVSVPSVDPALAPGAPNLDVNNGGSASAFGIVQPGYVLYSYTRGK